MRTRFKRYLILFLSALLAMPFTPVRADETVDNVVYVSDKGNDNYDGKSDVAPVKTLAKAIRMLYEGGTVVICGPLTVSSAFYSPESSQTVTVTSEYGGKDYGRTASAALNLKANITLNSSFVFRDLTISAKAKNTVFICNGNRVVFGDGITCNAAASANLPSITGSGATKYSHGGARLTVNSGSWLRLRGGNRSVGAVNGDTFIEINGGSFASLVEGGGASTQNGNVYMLINGGNFSGGVFGAAASDPVNGNVYIAVKGGSFKSIKATGGGAVNGDYGLYYLQGTCQSAAGTNDLVSGSSLVYTASAISANGFDSKEKDVQKAEEGYNGVAQKVREAFEIIERRQQETKKAWEKGLSAEYKGTGVLPDSLVEVKEGSGIELLSSTVTENVTSIGTGLGIWKISAIIVSVVAVLALFALILIKRPHNSVFALLAVLPVAVVLAIVMNSCGEGDTVTTESASAEPAPDGTEASTDSRSPVPDTNSTVWKYFGNASFNGEKIIMDSPGFYMLDENLKRQAKVEISFTVTSEGRVAICAPARLREENDLSTFTGYYFEVDSLSDTVTLYFVSYGQRTLIGSKKCTVDVGREYDAAIEIDTKSAEAIAFYFNDNPLDADPYPKFEIAPTNIKTGSFAFCCASGSAEFSVPVITVTEGMRDEGLTYTNPIISSMTDPEMFFYEGTYYLYGTRTSDNKNLYCYTSADGVNFKDAGVVMKGTDVWGESVFKAANILYRDGYFYMFYMANPASGDAETSYAYALSPLGPFVSDEKKPLSSGIEQIGGQPFVDEDGKVYLTVVRYGSGNVLWLLEIECNNGKVVVNEGSAVQLLDAEEEWECALASVVECGYIIKHNSKYYLIYAGGNYNSTYGVGFAVSDSVKGPYVKYPGNPIMSSNAQAYGVGAASVFPSPDGSEYFITYLRHESAYSVRPLNTCIDRMKFVPSELGYDIISIYGPTVTPQPAPSADKGGKAGELDRYISK